MRTKFTFAIMSIVTFLLGGCIENDVDYPYVGGVIREMSVEGMVNSTLNRSARTVDITINDEVDIQNLTITRLTVESDASVYPDATKAITPTLFPDKGFASLDSIPETADTRVNFTTPVNFLIQTYQDYNWTVTVTQVIDAYIQFEDIDHPQAAVFDRDSKQILVFVPEGTDLSEIRIENMQITSSLETVSPDPWESTFDFNEKQEFDVTVFGRTERWAIYAVESDEVEHDVTVFARTKQMVVTGKMQQGSNLQIEYKRKNARNWEILSDDYITIDRYDFSALIPGLSPLSQYSCRVTINGEEIGEYDTTTADLVELENGGFENWHSVQTGSTEIYYPWATGGIQYWGSGNRGATTVGGPSNTTPTDDTSTGKGNAAMLKSVYVSGVKLAAGNIFTGDFVDIELGSDGILSFGRQFLSYPKKLKLDYKYTSMPIDRYVTTDETTADIFKEFIGRADSCHIYVALTDWDEPRTIRTNKNVRQLFDVDDPAIIAYGEFVKGETTNIYETIEIDLVYRANRPVKYLTIVATSSKYGDYYCGGTGSTLWLDEMELVYD